MRPTTGTCLTSVGARRCLARRAVGAADCRGVYRPRARCHRYRDDRPTTVLPALPGRRVRRSLTPTQGGCTAQPWQVEDPLLIRHPPPVGARRCLARRAAGAADCRGVHRPRARCHRYRDDHPTTVLPALSGRRVRRSLTPTGWAIRPHRGRYRLHGDVPPHPCRGEALPRPPRRMGAADCRGVHRPRARCHRYRDDRPTTVLPALPGRRVRRSLTPTG
jgi:hypothetical protein